MNSQDSSLDNSGYLSLVPINIMGLIEIRYFEQSSQAFQLLLKFFITFDLCYSCLLFKPALVVYSYFNTLVRPILESNYYSTQQITYSICVCICPMLRFLFLLYASWPGVSTEQDQPGLSELIKSTTHISKDSDDI